MNFNSVDGADSFAALSFVALGFICHFAFAAGLVNIQNLLWANLDALSAADAEVFVYQDNFVHSKTFNFTSMFRCGISRKSQILIAPRGFEPLLPG